MYHKNFILSILLLFLVNCYNTNHVNEKITTLDSDFPINEPKIFALGKVTTQLQDWGISISRDWNEIYFTVSAIKGKGDSKSAIVTLKWLDGKWTEPEVVCFSGKYKDGCPNLSTDGNRLVFVSNRPTCENDTLNDGNLWCVERISGQWQEPYSIDIINTDKGEFFPTMAPGGDLFYCTNYQGRGKPARIYHSKYINGKYQKPNPIKGDILTDLGEYCPYILPDEKHMMIEIVDGENGLGDGDIYISELLPDGSWSKAKHLGNQINSSEHDCYPILTPDGGYIIYMSCRQPTFVNDDGKSSFNELLWDVTIPNKQPFDFYWVKSDFMKDFL